MYYGAAIASNTLTSCMVASDLYGQAVIVTYSGNDGSGKMGN